MKKFICFIVLATLALINFSAFAGNYEFTGYGYRSYLINSSGYITSDVHYSYVDYKIVINTDYDYATVQVDNDNAHVLTIVDQKVDPNPFKGIYFYCSGDITINLYTDHNGIRHIMINAPKVISVFDL